MKHLLPGCETPNYRDVKHFLPGNETPFRADVPGTETLLGGLSS